MNEEFLFEKFIEEWAEMYKPMKHNEKKNPRFFIAEDDYKLAQSFVHTRPTKSPIVVVTSNIEGHIEENFDHPIYSVYFFAQCDMMHEGRDTMVSKRQAKECAIALLNMLRTFKDGNVSLLERLPIKEGGYMWELKEKILDGKMIMRGIELSSLDYQSVSTLVDGWCGVYMTLTNIEPVMQCLDEADYI